VVVIRVVNNSLCCITYFKALPATIKAIGYFTSRNGQRSKLELKMGVETIFVNGGWRSWGNRIPPAWNQSHIQDNNKKLNWKTSSWN
jgi:hypothetical protein